MLYRRHRPVGLGRAQTLRRIRLRLCVDGPQGARFAMGRRRFIRRIQRISGQPRSLALHRRDAGGEAADRGGLRSQTRSFHSRMSRPLLRSVLRLSAAELSTLLVDLADGWLRNETGAPPGEGLLAALLPPAGSGVLGI